jgi:hypothetical protein
MLTSFLLACPKAEREKVERGAMMIATQLRFHPDMLDGDHVAARPLRFHVQSNLQVASLALFMDCERFGIANPHRFVRSQAEWTFYLPMMLRKVGLLSNLKPSSKFAEDKSDWISYDENLRCHRDGFP